MKVQSVCLDSRHNFSKLPASKIMLVAGKGVEGDAHFGETVKHRSRVAIDSTQPNLRQVHLVHDELLQELAKTGFQVGKGDLGENILTQGINLLGLPTGSILHVGPTAIVRVTGLRNPCKQLDFFQKGLTKAVLDRDEDGNLVRKAGVMAVVLKDGSVCAGDEIRVTYPTKPFMPLVPV